MMTKVIIFAVFIAILVIGLTIYVTNKAYSRRWEGKVDNLSKIDPIPDDKSESDQSNPKASP